MQTFDNVVVEAIKLTLLIYNNYNIVKKVSKTISKGKVTQSHLPTNMEFILNKIVFIKLYKKVSQIK